MIIIIRRIFIPRLSSALYVGYPERGVGKEGGRGRREEGGGRRERGGAGSANIAVSRSIGASFGW